LIPEEPVCGASRIVDRVLLVHDGAESEQPLQLGILVEVGG
jgi:hypothetical protein